MRRRLLLGITCYLVACGSSASVTETAGDAGGVMSGDAAAKADAHGHPQPSKDSGSSTRDGALDAHDARTTDAAAGPIGVHVVDGELVIDGKPTFLYGGDLHYFRVRDPNFDAAATQALWVDSVTKMAAAHMNLVTTYIPWDYHETAQGQFDFTGAKDLHQFLTTVCSAGMKVVAKPGPLITGEWPTGFGSFGAVPEWWKTANTGSLVLQSDGSPFSFSPLGDSSQQQPSYLDPTYLASVGAWFDQVVPILLPFIQSRCLIGVQVDNETNLYWSARFGSVDYSAPALASYQSFLTNEYATIDALNSAYGTSYGDFSDVVPPSDVPASLSDNVPARDWYDAGEAYVLAYLTKVRSMLESRGVKEPDVMFFTNDSPFGSPDAKVLIHDGTIKNQIGLCALDIYPKQFPTNSDISDYPFQPDYFTKLYGQENLLYTKDTGGTFAYAAELQGGFYDFALGVTPPVSAQATDQLLAKSFGHGVKGGSFYIIRGGLNADGSSYDYQAAIGLDGTLRPRYDVIQKWGAFLSTYGAELETADEVEDPIAIVQDGAYAVPQGGTNDDMQNMYTTEYNGLFGFLMEGGFNPHVVDARLVTDLSAYKEVFFLLPEMVDPATAAKLTAFHSSGGVVVQMLDPGTMALDGTDPPEVQALAALFPATANGSYTWPGTVFPYSGEANLDLSANSGEIETYWYETYWTPSQSGPLDILERTQPFGDDGRTIGFESPDGTAAFLGTYISSRYESNSYYEADATDLAAKVTLAQHYAGLAGITPTLSTNAVQEEVWARVARGDSAPVFVFVVNDQAAGTVHVNFGALSPLGLSASGSYVVTEALSGTAMGTMSGATLQSAGLDVALADYGTAVVVLQP